MNVDGGPRTESGEAPALRGEEEGRPSKGDGEGVTCDVRGKQRMWGCSNQVKKMEQGIGNDLCEMLR